MWYSFPFTPSLGLHIAFFRVPLHFELSDHPFPPISPQKIHPHFKEGFFLNKSDLIPVVWFIPKPCGTHFLLPYHLAYILQCLESPSTLNPPTIHFPQLLLKIFIPIYRGVAPQHVGLYHRRLVHSKTVWYSFPFTPSLGLHIAVFRVPLPFEPSDHPFPPISPRNIYPHSIEGSPISTSDFISVVWFTPRPCGTHFLLPYHLAYILQCLESPSTLNPAAIYFPNFTPKYLPHFIERSPLSTSDFIPVVWFIPKPCGTHFLLPHHLAYILQSLE